MGVILEYVGVNKNFGDKQVLKDINLKIKSNKIVGLLGKNGSGKSTLFKLANDLLTLSSGEVLIDGKPVSVESKKIVSYLPERTYLNPSLKVSDAVKLFETFYEDFDRVKAEKLLGELQLDMNMRLSGVDPASRDYILQTILKNFNKEATLLISTHMIADIEKILDEVIFIDEGKIVIQEDAEKLRKKENATIDEIFRRKFYVR